MIQNDFCTLIVGEGKALDKRSCYEHKFYAEVNGVYYLLVIFNNVSIHQICSP